MLLLAPFIHYSQAVVLPLGKPGMLISGFNSILLHGIWMSFLPPVDGANFDNDLNRKMCVFRLRRRREKIRKWVRGRTQDPSSVVHHVMGTLLLSLFSSLLTFVFAKRLARDCVVCTTGRGSKSHQLIGRSPETDRIETESEERWEWKMLEAMLHFLPIWIGSWKSHLIAKFEVWLGRVQVHFCGRNGRTINSPFQQWPRIWGNPLYSYNHFDLDPLILPMRVIHTPTTSTT